MQNENRIAKNRAVEGVASRGVRTDIACASRCTQDTARRHRCRVGLCGGPRIVIPVLDSDMLTRLIQNIRAATACKRRLNSRGNSAGRFPPIGVILVCRKTTSLAQSPVLQGLGCITFMGLQELMGRSVRESTACRRDKRGDRIDRIRPLLWLLFSRPANRDLEKTALILDFLGDHW